MYEYIVNYCADTGSWYDTIPETTSFVVSSRDEFEAEFEKYFKNFAAYNICLYAIKNLSTGEVIHHWDFDD